MADTLQSAIEAIKAGNRAAGQQLLVQYLKANPNSEAAWLWMAITFDEADKKRKCLNTALEIILKQHTGLRDLKERRRREEIADRLEDSKPLEDVLESLLRQSPTLSTLFLQGQRISNPFRTTAAQAVDQPFEGKRYPTYFKFRGRRCGEELRRNCNINLRARICFETDVVNDYFSRSTDPGEFSLFLISDHQRVPVKNYALNLQNGIATLSVTLPANCRVGDQLGFVATVTDRTRADPFENMFSVNVKEAAPPSEGRGAPRRCPPSAREGSDREVPSGIELPKIIKVYERSSDTHKTWQEMDPPFDKWSALRVKHAGRSDENGNAANAKDVYDFYLNVDNTYLKTEMKAGRNDPKVTEARFVYGMVLLGLGLLRPDAQQRKHGHEDDGGFSAPSESDNAEDRVEQVTKAVAPVLLPMIDYLGALDLESHVDAHTGSDAA